MKVLIIDNTKKQLLWEQVRKYDVVLQKIDIFDTFYRVVKDRTGLLTTDINTKDPFRDCWLTDEKVQQFISNHFEELV